LELKAKPRKDEEAMKRIVLFLAGVVAWASVGLLAALIAFSIGDNNQVLMFLPILAAVVVAWAIGELVTERVFNQE
jgi:flagellar biosynthesis protein FliQ